MTPKEKAEELIEKFWIEVEDNNYQTRKMSFKQAKQCALIVVNEIINASPSLPILGDSGTYSEDIELSTNYWQEVKQEIISNL